MKEQIISIISIISIIWLCIVQGETINHNKVDYNIKFKEPNDFNLLSVWKTLEQTRKHQNTILPVQDNSNDKQIGFKILFESNKIEFLKYFMFISGILNSVLTMITPVKLHQSLRSQSITIFLCLQMIDIYLSSTVEVYDISESSLNNVKQLISDGVKKLNGHVVIYSFIALLSGASPKSTWPLILAYVPFFIKYSLFIFLVHFQPNDSISPLLQTIENRLKFVKFIMPSFVQGMIDISQLTQTSGEIKEILYVDTLSSPDPLVKLCNILSLGLEILYFLQLLITFVNEIIHHQVSGTVQLLNKVFILFLMIQYVVSRTQISYNLGDISFNFILVKCKEFIFPIISNIRDTFNGSRSYIIKSPTLSNDDELKNVKKPKKKTKKSGSKKSKSSTIKDESIKP
jgi:hypothetical protein